MGQVNPFQTHLDETVNPLLQQNPEARPSFQALLASLKQMLDYSDTTE